ncbi:transposase [Paenibacillus sp. p3-SID867]|uniref:IS66 family transposase n=1 Tax=Paenibacillus sp. p3-SID867 TaxID=2916363 RepID=UPI0021A3AFBF|nr:transposase [Paenibacillus sp. p3-SID867]MCT1402838.1 transposase [Paenibacillus sp. p3-SID867]
MYRQLEEIRGRLNAVESDLKKEKREHKEDVDRLNRKIEEKDREIKVLTEDNERLKRINNNDSSNSSLPPSTDQKGKPANTYNGRNTSGKEPGGQPGHKGGTLTKADVEEQIRKGSLTHKVKHVGKTSERYVSKYVIDVEITSVATEFRFYEDASGKIEIPPAYWSDVVYGPNLKAMIVDLYAEGVVSNDRICGFIHAFSDGKLALSEGSIYNFCRDFSVKCAPALAQIEEELLNESTLSTDATVITVNGKQAYIRNQSSGTAILYSPMEKKDLETLKETGILSRFSGTFMHDHETAMYHFGTGNGECNVYLLRYLQKNTEESENSWSGDLSERLCGMNEARKDCLKSERVFSEEELASYDRDYDAIVIRGVEENKRTKGKYARAEEKKLLNRLKQYKDNHLLFLYDFTVPFDNYPSSFLSEKT